jgi:hypothetical protein
MLASTQTTYRPHPAQRLYQPYGAALTLFYSKVPELVLSGPAGTGKSRACLEKLHLCALKYAGMRGLIIRKTRESLSEAALVTYEDKVLHEYDALHDGPRRNFRQAYHYPNKSEIVVGGLDKPGKIMSTEYDMIYVQEATELDLVDWLSLTTRLRNNVMPYQQLLADCNPDAPTHWLWLRAQSQMVTMLHSRHEDNPRLYRSGDWTAEGREYREKLERLGTLNPETGQREGAEYQRLGLGQWVQASGVVYGVWVDGPPDGNVTETAEYIPDGGDVLWSVDDGYSGALDPQTNQYTANSHPRVFGLYQLRHDGTIARFAESYRTQTLSERHIERVQELGYPAPEYAVVDSSAAELRGRLAEQGIGTYGGTHPVDEGIKVLRRFLAPDANGRRRFIVHPRCTHFRAEMASYRYDVATGKPVKQFDHGPDEARMMAWKLRYD